MPISFLFSAFAIGSCIDNYAYDNRENLSTKGFMDRHFTNFWLFKTKILHSAKMGHQIASIRSSFCKSFLLLRGAHPPSDTPLRRGGATCEVSMTNIFHCVPPTFKIIPPRLLKDPPVMYLVHCRLYMVEHDPN